VVINKVDKEKVQVVRLVVELIKDICAVVHGEILFIKLLDINMVKEKNNTKENIKNIDINIVL